MGRKKKHKKKPRPEIVPAPVPCHDPALGLGVLESVFVGQEYGLTLAVSNGSEHGLYIEEAEVVVPGCGVTRCEDVTHGAGPVPWSPVWVAPGGAARLSLRVDVGPPGCHPDSGVVIVMVSPANGTSKVALRSDFLIRSWTRPCEAGS